MINSNYTNPINFVAHYALVIKKGHGGINGCVKISSLIVNFYNGMNMR